MTAEERAELKKREIEAELQRYKLARKSAKAQEEVEGGAPKEGSKGYNPADVEVKMDGKAFEKFRQIDASGAAPVTPQQSKKSSEPSKWDKKDEKPVGEVVNRRTVEEDNGPEDEDAFDVKNLMNKFKKYRRIWKSKDSNFGEADAGAAVVEAKNNRWRRSSRR